MPLWMVSQYRSNLARLRGIAFDVGIHDENPVLVSSAREFSRVLRQNGIAHQFEEFEGSTKIGQLSAFKARFCRSSRENFSTGRLRSNMYTRESKELRPGCVFSLSITGKLDIGRGQSESRRPRQHRANAALLWPRTQFFSPRR